MKITRLNTELNDFAPDTTSESMVLPEPLNADWLQSARQAVVDAQIKHAETLGTINTLTASLAALDTLLARCDAQAQTAAALSERVEKLRRKIPLVATLLEQANVQERDARMAVRDAQEDAFLAYANNIDLSALVHPLLHYRAALRAAGRGEAFQFRLDEQLNSRHSEESASNELRALLAIPGREPDLTPEIEPEPVALSPREQGLSLVPTTPGHSLEAALVGYQLGAEPVAPPNEYRAATQSFYAVRKAA